METDRGDRLNPQAAVSGDLDPAGLMERLDGDRELLREIIPVFLADVRERMGRIGSAIRAGDWTMVHAEAHTIKGSSGTLCAGNLQRAARELERADGCCSEAMARFESLQRCFERLEPQLRSLMSFEEV